MADAVETVKGAYEAFARQDIPAVLSIMDEGIDWHVPEVLPHGMEAHDVDGVGRFFQKIGETWEELNVDIKELVADGNRVVGFGRVQGKLRDGGPASYGFVHSWTFGNGKAVRFDEYVDPDESVLGS